MAILPGVARTPRMERATLPGSMWIRMNVRIMTPITTATAWPMRRTRYAVTRVAQQRSRWPASGSRRGVIPDLRVERTAERVERGDATQGALVNDDVRLLREPQPGQLPRRVVLVGVERLGAGAVFGRVDQAVHLRALVAALVAGAVGVEPSLAGRVETVVRVIAEVHELPGAGRRRVRARVADANRGYQRVERLGLQVDLDAGLRLR